MALPEGVMLNYLSRRENPTPYFVFMLVESMAYGEDNMLRSFKRAMPDYFIIVHKDTTDYGIRFFGVEQRYGKAIMEWIYQNYETQALFGHEPLKNERFGIKIMRRKAPR